MKNSLTERRAEGTLSNTRKDELKANRELLVRELEDAGAVVKRGTVRCPFHVDKDPSGSIHNVQGTDSWNFKCHGCGFSGDVFAVISKHKGKDVGDVLKEFAAEDDTTRRKSTSSFATRDAAVNSLGTPEKVYEYSNDFAVVRLKDKKFRPLSRCGGKWFVQDPSGELPLYRVSELRRSGTVYVVEGEKACDAGHSIGLATVTSAHGAKSARKSDWTPLAGREVVILPDNDESGQRYAEDVAGILRDLDPATKVKIVVLPGLPPKGDLFDFVEHRDSLDSDDIIAQVKDVANEVPWLVETSSAELVPLDDPEPVQVPVEVCKGWLHEWVTALSQATETPVELALLNSLVAVSTAMGGRFVVAPERDYFEEVALYTATILPSGSRKSAVLTKCFSPHYDREQDMHRAFDVESRRSAAIRQARQHQIKGLQDEAQAALGESNDERFHAIMDRIAEVEANLPPLLVPPRLVTSDVTPEHLATMLAQQGERLAIVSDEGGFFDTLAGRYSQHGTANLDLVLQAYSGSAVRVDRGSRPPVCLQHPVLQIALTPQPAVASEILLKPGFKGRGLLARFLFAYPKSNLGYRSLNPSPIPDGVAQLYSEQLNQISEAPNGRHVLTFTPDAYKMWKAYQRRIENAMAPGGRFCELSEVAGKLPGQVARVAAVMHVAEHAGAPTQQIYIEADTMRRAVLLVECLEEHALRVYGIVAVDHRLAIARRLWAEILKQEADTFSVRSIWEPTRKLYPRREDIEPGIGVLVERGWIVPVQRGSGVGRKSERYKLSPESFAHFAHRSQVGEKRLKDAA